MLLVVHGWFSVARHDASESITATVLAVNPIEEKFSLAKEVGAHHAFPSDAGAADKVWELTGGRGAGAAVDFVGGQR